MSRLPLLSLTAGKERAEEKGNFPHIPFKEKEGEKETPPPPPVACPNARMRAREAAGGGGGGNEIVRKGPAGVRLIVSTTLAADRFVRRYGRDFWAIFDLAKHEKHSRGSAERLYYRHLARLREVFGVSQVG